LDEGVLGRVLRLRRIPKHAQCYSIHRQLVASHQLFESGKIAGLSGANEVNVFGLANHAWAPSREFAVLELMAGGAGLPAAPQDDDRAPLDEDLLACGERELALVGLSDDAEKPGSNRGGHSL